MPRCNSDWHEGLTCEEFQAQQAQKGAKISEADRRFEEWRVANALTCPGCGHAVQKRSKDECNKLT